MTRVADARTIELPDGRRIWVAPNGFACWCHTGQSQSLTLEEDIRYGIPHPTRRVPHE